MGIRIEQSFLWYECFQTTFNTQLLEFVDLMLLLTTELYAKGLSS